MSIAKKKLSNHQFAMELFKDSSKYGCVRCPCEIFPNEGMDFYMSGTTLTANTKITFDGCPNISYSYVVVFFACYFSGVGHKSKDVNYG